MNTTPHFIAAQQPDPQVLRQELIAGLLAELPQVAPKFLYDALGSRLFEAITELDEYYPTRTEAAIMATHAGAIAAACAGTHTLVDLGAGSCAKAEALFATLRPQRYVAVDIAVEFLHQSVNALQQRHPHIEMLGVGTDFATTLSLPAAAGAGPRTLFYPGSSIGNFTPAAALVFLKQARAAAQGGRLLIGVDLVKPVAVLEPAYDDALGVTAAFNLNLLRHANRLIGADFELRQWQHVALFEPTQSRIEMHLQARQDLTVQWPGGARNFRAGQRIHTENSYKYRCEDFAALLRDAGFNQVQSFCDEREWFAVFTAAA